MQKLEITHFKSHHFGIETPVVPTWYMQTMSLNRTILELKLQFDKETMSFKYFKSHHFGIETKNILHQWIRLIIL